MQDAPSAAEEVWTPLRLISWTSNYLQEKGVAGARREAEWLLGAATGMSRLAIYLNFDKPLEPAELVRFRGLVKRRGQREPLQYLLGDQDFMGRRYLVNPAVLIPRDDTAVLVQQALALVQPGTRVLDVGTGSGCVAISLACEAPQAVVCAGDISAEALQVAVANAQALGGNVQFRHGDLYAPFQGERFDIIVSNPPYIRHEQLESLQPEVVDYEPHLALDGGIDGLCCYRRLIQQAPLFLKDAGHLLVEVGFDQATLVSAMMLEAGFCSVKTFLDTAGIERVVAGGWYASP